MTAPERTVGIRELKAQLSHYVKLAHDGERIVVTQRGLPVAELRSFTPASPGLAQLIESGAVRWSGGKPKRFPKPMKIRGGPISDTVSELRDADDPLRRHQ